MKGKRRHGEDVSKKERRERKTTHHDVLFSRSVKLYRLSQSDIAILKLFNRFRRTNERKGEKREKWEQIK